MSSVIAAGLNICRCLYARRYFDAVAINAAAIHTRTDFDVEAGGRTRNRISPVIIQDSELCEVENVHANSRLKTYDDATIRM